MQPISLSDTKIYISKIRGNLPDSYWRQLLEGWMKFMAPLSPSDVDDIDGLKYVRDAHEPIQHIPESVFQFLHAVSTAGRAQLSGDSFVIMTEAWPTMWTWIQLLYLAHHTYIQTTVYLRAGVCQRTFASENIEFLWTSSRT